MHLSVPLSSSVFVRMTERGDCAHVQLSSNIYSLKLAELIYTTCPPPPPKKRKPCTSNRAKPSSPSSRQAPNSLSLQIHIIPKTTKHGVCSCNCRKVLYMHVRENQRVLTLSQFNETERMTDAFSCLND